MAEEKNTQNRARTNHSAAQGRRRKKKAPLWIRILVIVASVLFLLLLFGIIFVFAELDKMNQAESVEQLSAADEYFETDESSMYDVMNPDDVQWSENERVNGEDDVTNILLIGQDRRPGENRARSDTMIIASINKTDNTIKLISLMRDMYVQLPGYSDNRINAAYAFGGMELLDSTIKKNFDIDIDGNIEVDFTGFEKAIDCIDGIEIELTAEEAEYMNKSSSSIGSVSSGLQHLNGAQALAYARIRYVGNGDFGRTERQRKVLMAAYEKVKKMSLTEMLDLADVVLPLITTDQNTIDLISLATTVYMMDISEIENHNIPEDASYKAATIQGMAVLVPDLDECRKKLSDIIYGD